MAMMMTDDVYYTVFIQTQLVVVLFSKNFVQCFSVCWILTRSIVTPPRLCEISFSLPRYLDNIRFRYLG